MKIYKNLQKHPYNSLVYVFNRKTVYCSKKRLFGFRKFSIALIVQCYIASDFQFKTYQFQN